MPTLNASSGGVFVRANPVELPGLEVGVPVELVLFTPDDVGDDVAARAKVIRLESGRDSGHPAGFGLAFTEIDATNRERLRRILAR